MKNLLLFLPLLLCCCESIGTKYDLKDDKYFMSSYESIINESAILRENTEPMPSYVGNYIYDGYAKLDVDTIQELISWLLPKSSEDSEYEGVKVGLLVDLSQHVDGYLAEDLSNVVDYYVRHKPDLVFHFFNNIFNERKVELAKEKLIDKLVGLHSYSIYWAENPEKEIELSMQKVLSVMPEKFDNDYVVFYTNYFSKIRAEHEAEQ